jgi:hypothetical protein
MLSPLLLFAHDTYLCFATSRWAEEGENPTWVMKRVMQQIGIGIGYRLDLIFLDKQDLAQPISGFDPAISHQLAVMELQCQRKVSHKREDL